MMKSVAYAMFFGAAIYAVAAVGAAFVVHFLELVFQ